MIRFNIRHCCCRRKAESGRVAMSDFFYCRFLNLWLASIFTSPSSLVFRKLEQGRGELGTCPSHHMSWCLHSPFLLVFWVDWRYIMRNKIFVYHWVYWTMKPKHDFGRLSLTSFWARRRKVQAAKPSVCVHCHFVGWTIDWTCLAFARNCTGTRAVCANQHRICIRSNEKNYRYLEGCCRFGMRSPRQRSSWRGSCDDNDLWGKSTLNIQWSFRLLTTMSALRQ